MEVDQFAVDLYAGEGSRLPLIDESAAFGNQAPKDRLIAVLDQVEMRVERLRRDTVRIEEERDSLLSTLDSIKHSELLSDVTECKYHDDVNRLIAVMDQVEMRVERLRRDTVRLEEERDSLLSTLDSIKHSELLSDVTECKYHDDVNRLIAVMDQVEMRVERLRRDTVRLEEERDSLLSTLDSIKHSELLSDVTECKYHDDVNRLIAVMDQVEMRVERLRRDTVRIEEERDSLLSTLDSIKHSELLSDVTECDKDDITRYADRILARAMTVEVAVRTDRDAQQEEALHQVNMYIDQLVMTVHDDAVIAHTRCQTFMNACTSQPDPSTGTDKNFESAILGCTLDDQKRVKKRLQGLLDYFAKLNVTTCS